MLTFKNTTKFFKTPEGKKMILDNVSLKIEAEKGVAILGMNGAGKSTLVRMISGVELPNSGTITRDGRVSWPMGLSGSFQPALSGRENIRFAAMIYGQDPDAVTEQVEEFAELESYLDMPVSTYSNGMKSRLAFGLSIAIAFDIYLIDEITSVGDRLFKEKSKQLLQETVRQSKVVLISHDEKTVRELCDQCVILAGGQLTHYPSIDDAFQAFKQMNRR